MEKVPREQDWFARILREGWVQKRSKYLKKWRTRWLVLTPQCLWTFERRQDYQSLPTERIDLERCSGVRPAATDLETSHAHSFLVDTPSRFYSFSVSSNSERDSWVTSIGLAILQPSSLLSPSERDFLDGREPSQ